MSKNETTKNSSRVNQIFDDLENYLNFCREYGYKYNEADLYSNRSYAYRQFSKFQSGKNFKDMWDLDNTSRE